MIATTAVFKQETNGLSPGFPAFMAVNLGIHHTVCLLLILSPFTASCQISTIQSLKQSHQTI